MAYNKIKNKTQLTLVQNMKTRFFTALLIISGACQAQQPEMWGLPDIDVLIPAVDTICKDQRNSAVVTMGLRNDGLKRTEVESLIPKDYSTFRLRSVEVMHENVEDIFQYKNISSYSYYVFRSEICLREVLEAKRFNRFSSIAETIDSCQKSHGTEKNKELYLCIRRAVRTLSSI